MFKQLGNFPTWQTLVVYITYRLTSTNWGMTLYTQHKSLHRRHWHHWHQHMYTGYSLHAKVVVDSANCLGCSNQSAVTCNVPPSPWMGSTMTATTGAPFCLLNVSIRSSTWDRYKTEALTPTYNTWVQVLCSPTCSRHLCSSSLFSLTNSSRGYLSWGKGATGQSNAGKSILWIAFEWVQERAPGERRGAEVVI